MPVAAAMLELCEEALLALEEALLELCEDVLLELCDEDEDEALPPSEPPPHAFRINPADNATAQPIVFFNMQHSPYLNSRNKFNYLIYMYIVHVLMLACVMQDIFQKVRLAEPEETCTQANGLCLRKD